jgi:hypothetical protein
MILVRTSNPYLRVGHHKHSPYLAGQLLVCLPPASKIEQSVESPSRGVTNTKMNTKIYTSSGRQSVIPYVQFG